MYNDGTDFSFLQEGYVRAHAFPAYILNIIMQDHLFMYLMVVCLRLFQITVTPLGALTNADIDCHTFFNQWLPECTSSAV